MAEGKIPKEPLNLRVSVPLKRRLQHWCIDHQRDITELLSALAERMLDGEIPVPPAPLKEKKAKAGRKRTPPPAKKRRK